MSQEFASFMTKLTGKNKLFNEGLSDLLTEFEFPTEPTSDNLTITQIQLPFTHVFDETTEGSLFKLINIYEEFIEELLQIADVKADSFCKRTSRKYIRCKHEHLNNSKIAILNLIQKSLTGAPGYKECLNDRIITAEEGLGQKFILISIKFGLVISPGYHSELIILPASESWEVNKDNPALADKLTDIEVVMPD